MLSNFIRGCYEDLRDLPQRPDYHPEIWVYDHMAYVLDGVRTITGYSGSRLRELELVAMFHDIAKLDTTKRSSKGVLTSYNHSRRALPYWGAVAPYVSKEMDVRPDVVRWLIENHMKPKFFGRTKQRKIDALKQEAEELGREVWVMLKAFSECDDMLAYFERNGMYHPDGEATDTLQSLHGGDREMIERSDDAIAEFDLFVDEVVDLIRSGEERGDGSKQLVLLRGVPGAGKTEFAKSVLGPKTRDVDSDDYFVHHVGDTNTYEFDKSELGNAHRWCESQAEQHMSDGQRRIAVHNTFTQPWEMVPYYAMASRHGYRVYSVIVENRHQGQNTHGVPQNKLNMMENRFHVKLQ